MHSIMNIMLQCELRWPVVKEEWHRIEWFPCDSRCNVVLKWQLIYACSFLFDWRQNTNKKIYVDMSVGNTAQAEHAQHWFNSYKCAILVLPLRFKGRLLILTCNVIIRKSFFMSSRQKGLFTCGFTQDSNTGQWKSCICLTHIDFVTFNSLYNSSL